jgi:hypothetical protein
MKNIILNNQQTFKTLQTGKGDIWDKKSAVEFYLETASQVNAITNSLVLTMKRRELTDCEKYILDILAS